MEQRVANSGSQDARGVCEAPPTLDDLTRAFIHRVGIEEFNRRYAGQLSIDHDPGLEIILRTESSSVAQRLGHDPKLLQDLATQCRVKGISIQSSSADIATSCDVEKVLSSSTTVGPAPHVIGDWNSPCILKLRNWLVGAAVPSFAIFGTGAGVSTLLMDVVHWPECQGRALYLGAVAPLITYLNDSLQAERDAGSEAPKYGELVRRLEEALFAHSVLILDHCTFENLDRSGLVLLSECIARATERGVKVIFAFPHRPVISRLPHILQGLLRSSIFDGESKWSIELEQPKERDRMMLARHFIKQVPRWTATELGLKQLVRACPSGSVGDLKGAVTTAIGWASVHANHAWVLDGNVARTAVHGSGLIRVKKLISLGAPRVAIAKIQRVVCQQLEISPDRVRPNIRKPDVMIAKRLIAYFSYCMSGRSFPEIAAELVGKESSFRPVSHAAVLAHVRWVEAVLKREAGGQASATVRGVRAPDYCGLTLTQIVLNLKSVLLAPHS